ncbi:LytTR family DNA-binding domain-containing protein [Sphingobacterium sp. JB170]|uniref:LytR/AlgR family response regulator transcription factor n=1 Tax=Sphingobacterium sp. JB170 TaxID=1434842 RepID=UPI00097ED92C|nr:response regulator [Sphingobacterium sp. JB170]SJN50444.1 Two-component system response regulator [Sphingobacterium sp. JB170]
MKSCTLYIIDDDSAAINILKDYIGKTSCQLVGSSTDPRIGIQEVHKKKVDIVFLDMQMQPINGLEVMPQLPLSTKVIFCTSYQELAMEAYQTYWRHFLLKPFSFHNFYNILGQTAATLSSRSFIGEGSGHESDFKFFSGGIKGVHKKLWYEDMVYACSLKDKTQIYLIDGETYVINQRIGKLIKSLPSTRFARISKEIIVSLSAIELVEYGKVGVTIAHRRIFLDIGGAYSKDFYNWILDNS